MKTRDLMRLQNESSKHHHGNIEMARSKRRRLVLVREPNGRPSRAGYDREYAPTQIKRLRDAAMIGLRDSEWGTELGRLFLERVITAEMYAAGKWRREMAREYHIAIGAPQPDPKPVSYQRGISGTLPDPDSEAGKERTRRDIAAIAVFQEAHAALLGAGKVAEMAVRRLCEQDQGPVGIFELQYVRRGLLWIAGLRSIGG